MNNFWERKEKARKEQFQDSIDLRSTDPDVRAAVELRIEKKRQADYRANVYIVCKNYFDKDFIGVYFVNKTLVPARTEQDKQLCIFNTRLKKIIPTKLYMQIGEQLLNPDALYYESKEQILKKLSMDFLEESSSGLAKMALELIRTNKEKEILKREYEELQIMFLKWHKPKPATEQEMKDYIKRYEAVYGVDEIF